MSGPLSGYLTVGVTLSEGSRATGWRATGSRATGWRRPRVRGLTRGFTPASRSGIQPPNGKAARCRDRGWLLPPMADAAGPPSV